MEKNAKRKGYVKHYEGETFYIVRSRAVYLLSGEAGNFAYGFGHLCRQ